MSGQLYLLPTTLGADNLQTIPPYVIDRIHQLEVFIVERGKTARQFIKQTKTPIPFAEMQFFELNKRTNPADWKSFLLPALNEGKDIGLISEAGCPGVADPGAEIAQLAHQLGIRVNPMVGPSSILLALMASGMNGQQFAFHGYLPIKNPDRKKKLQQLEQESRRNQQTQLFIETPYRNNALLEESLQCLHNNTLFCVAADITLPTEYIYTLPVGEWQKATLPDLHKRPTLFLLLAP